MSTSKEKKKITYEACPWCGSPNLDLLFRTIDRSGSGETFPIVDCHDCKFRFTQDVPTSEEIGPYYDFQEYISHSDTKQGFSDRIYHWVRERMLRKKYKLIKKHADPTASRVLDYGSGTGYFLNYLKLQGWETKGIEINTEARQNAIEKFGLDISSPDIYEETVGPFDVITLWHVLEHLYDFKEKIESFYEKLAPQGILVLALPNHNSTDAKKLKQDWAAYDTPRHLWHFSPKIIKELATKFSFEYQAAYPMPYDAFYVSILSQQLKPSSNLAFLKGGILGLLSNINCTFNPEMGSSIIYILKKNESTY